MHFQFFSISPLFYILCSLMLVVSAVYSFSHNDLGLFCSLVIFVSKGLCPNSLLLITATIAVYAPRVLFIFFFNPSTVPIRLALEKIYHAHVLILNSLCSSQPLPMRFCPKLIMYFQILFESHPWKDHLHSYSCFLY